VAMQQTGKQVSPNSRIRRRRTQVSGLHSRIAYRTVYRTVSPSVANLASTPQSYWLARFFFSCEIAFGSTPFSLLLSLASVYLARSSSIVVCIQFVKIRSNGQCTRSTELNRVIITHPSPLLSRLHSPFLSGLHSTLWQPNYIESLEPFLVYILSLRHPATSGHDAFSYRLLRSLTLPMSISSRC